METKKAPQIPYGISDFVRMRTENYYYVDKTMYLPLIEDTASYIFMIRPRRFGKSLFLSIMKAYYDMYAQGGVTYTPYAFAERRSLSSCV